MGCNKICITQQSTIWYFRLMRPFQLDRHLKGQQPYRVSQRRLLHNWRESGKPVICITWPEERLFSFLLRSCARVILPGVASMGHDFSSPLVVLPGCAQIGMPLRAYGETNYILMISLCAYVDGKYITSLRRKSPVTQRSVKMQQHLVVKK